MAYRKRTGVIQRLFLGIGSLAALVPASALGDDAAPVPPPPQGVWSGKGQLGFVQDQGNIDSKTANAMLDASYVEDPWKHTLHLEGLYGASAGIASAERWIGQWQSNYLLTKSLFAFGALNYDYDLFSGFEYQGSVTAGVGYALINSTATKLSVQVGGGYNLLRPETLMTTPSGLERSFGPRESDAIATAGLDYSQTLTATTSLSDKLLVDTGSLNTLINNTLALTVKLSNRLALSVGYSVQDNTKPPDGLKKIETIETLNLVFGF